MSTRHLKTAIRILREKKLSDVANTIFRKLENASTPPFQGPVKPVWSEYRSWLTLANAGMLIRENAYCFDYAVRNLPSKAPIVEIGSFCGLSTNLISYSKQQHGVTNPLVTCDKWLFEGAESGRLLGDSPTISHQEYREFVKGTYMRNVQMFSRDDLPYTIEAFSDEFFAAWAQGENRTDVFGRPLQLGGPISFCYIDGNHTYDFAKRDFENCDKYLERGGFVLFDDSGDGTEWEVCKVVREVMATGRYELLDRNPNYFFQKKA